MILEGIRMILVNYMLTVIEKMTQESHEAAEQNKQQDRYHYEEMKSKEYFNEVYKNDVRDKKDDEQPTIKPSKRKTKFDT